jgi:lysophospholipase L1-like esterase
MQAGVSRVRLVRGLLGNRRIPPRHARSLRFFPAQRATRILRILDVTILARSIRRLVVVSVIVSVAGLPIQAQQNWVGSWAASQQLVEPQNSIPGEDQTDTTLRQMVHLTIGGAELRLHLSNRYGSAPLRIASVHIARPVSSDSSRINPGSDQALAFSGRPDVTIPAGADYLSDPVKYSMAPLSDMAITIHLETVPTDQTGHPGSRSTSYMVHGDEVATVELQNPTQLEHWYFIAGIDVLTPASAVSAVALGDSITDGHGATTNGNDRWPDLLARRLQAIPQGRTIAVLNHGIGGNRLLLDGLGPNALARFDDDVIAQAGVRSLIVLEGINDIGMLGRSGEATPAENEQLVHDIIGAYQQIIDRAHTHGINVLGCTILPFAGSSFYHPGPASEADRQMVNKWIRTPGHFDAVIDFDQVMRDPASPDHLLPKFDSGDHLHPSPAGYAAMADAVPLGLLMSPKGPGPMRPTTARSAASHH